MKESRRCTPRRCNRIEPHLCRPQNRRMLAARLLAPLLLAAAGAAQADPGYYVITPYDQAGTTTLELRHWSVKPRDGAERVWPELAIGHGFTSRWTTLLLASFIGPSDQRTRLSLLSWQNNWLLTQGEWPIDIALHGNLIRPADRSDGHTLEFGPLLQGDIGRTQWNANLLFERRFGTDEPRPTALKYQWQLRHRWRPALHWGVQGFGELGDWNDWAPRSRQSHRAGPSLFTTLQLLPGWTVDASAAVLLGSTYSQHGRMVTLRVAASF
jgi:hypothetical protein